MKINSKNSLFFIIPAGCLIMIILCAPIKNKIVNSICALKTIISCKEMKDCPKCAIYFTDNVNIQEKAYKKEKIIKQRTFEKLDELFNKRILNKIITNKNYNVENMNFARPYVLPQVVDFLDTLSGRYRKSLNEKGISYYPFTITNATRTIESAKELSKINKIARKNSHHLLGKTIDISYKKFCGNEIRLVVFIETLMQLKRMNKCYVKYELNGALHLTVR